MDPSWLANFNNVVVENTASKSSLMVANFKLLKVLEKKKKEIKRLKKSLKHKDQQILALRNYISEMKKENPITNDVNACTGILYSFGKYKDLITNRSEKYIIIF